MTQEQNPNCIFLLPIVERVKALNPSAFQKKSLQRSLLGALNELERHTKYGLFVERGSIIRENQPLGLGDGMAVLVSNAVIDGENNVSYSVIEPGWRGQGLAESCARIENIMVEQRKTEAAITRDAMLRLAAAGSAQSLANELLDICIYRLIQGSSLKASLRIPNVVPAFFAMLDEEREIQATFVSPLFRTSIARADDIVMNAD